MAEYDLGSDVETEDFYISSGGCSSAEEAESAFEDSKNCFSLKHTGTKYIRSTAAFEDEHAKDKSKRFYKKMRGVLDVKGRDEFIDIPIPTSEFIGFRDRGY